MGKGTESVSRVDFISDVLFMNIENIHAVRASWDKVCWHDLFVPFFSLPFPLLC